MIHDKKIEKKKIIVAVTGGIDSVVSAYLLKKQGYDVISIGITFSKIENEQTFVGVSNLKNLEDIKQIMNTLDIPFFGVDGSKMYQSLVTDPLISSRIAGYIFNPHLACTQVIFNILMDKMKKVGATKIATGHFAKIIKNQTTGTFNVFTANDLEFDQSHLLSKLNQEVLEKTYLPLSEMRKVEVEKVSKMLAVKFRVSEKRSININEHPNFFKFIDEKIPRSLLKDGQVIEYKTELVLGDHEGVHQYYLGQENLKSKTGTMLDKSLMVTHIEYGNGVVYLSYKHDLSFNRILVNSIVTDPSLDMTKPFDLYFQVGMSRKREKATIHFYNNQICLLEIAQEISGTLHKGEFITFYNKAGIGAKVLGNGFIFKTGVFDIDIIRSLPKRREELLVDEDDDEEKKDIYAFKF